MDGKVYNATPYLSKHPGGKDIVLTHAGAWWDARASACARCFPLARVPAAAASRTRTPEPPTPSHHPPPPPPPFPPPTFPAGGDATSGFTDTGHSASAKQDLAKLQVGVLSAEDKEEVVRLAKEKAEKEGSGIGVAAFVAAGVGLAGMLAWQFLGAGKK